MLLVKRKKGFTLHSKIRD